MSVRRKIVRIDEEKCNGCGECVPACAEGALQVIDGKARLVSDVYCDGLGACLGRCPQDAITVEERDADEFDEGVAKAHVARTERSTGQPAHPACPGAALKDLADDAPAKPRECPEGEPIGCGKCCGAIGADQPPSFRLGNWPVQLMLVPPGAPLLDRADILVCADCVAYAVPDFHARYLPGRAVLVGCPKLDDLAFYREKLKKIFERAQPASVTVLRMEVPCCAGIADAAVGACHEVLPNLPVEVHTIGLRGTITRDILGGPTGTNAARNE